MHPSFTQVPPTSPISIRATLAPNRAASAAAGKPPCPAPIMTKSNCFMGILLLVVGKGAGCVIVQEQPFGRRAQPNQEQDEGIVSQPHHVISGCWPMLLLVCRCSDDRRRSRRRSNRRVTAVTWYRNRYTYGRPVSNSGECPTLPESRIQGRSNKCALQFPSYISISSARHGAKRS